MGETMMLGLRLLQDGVSAQSFARRHGVSLFDQFAPQLPGWPQLGCSRLPTKCTATKRGAVGKLGLRGVSLSLGCSADSEFDSSPRTSY